jgi:hypothetical protein
MRPRITWLIAAALVIVGLAAGVDALRSNDTPPPAEASATQASTTHAATTNPELAATPPSAQLVTGQVVKLLPGRVSTDALGMEASFEVFPHWYGYQVPGLVRLGPHTTPGGLEVSLDRGGIEVNALDSPLARAARRLETAAGIRIHNVSPVRLGGYSGRRYSGPSEHDDVILLGVPHGTLVIRKFDAIIRRFEDDQERREIERVIQSLTFRP